MKPFSVACLLLIIATLPGCKTIESDHLIGGPISAEDAQMYEGVWRFADSLMHVKHTEGANFVMANLEWDEGEFVVHQMDMVITSHGDARFIQVIAEDDDEDDEAEDEDEGDDELDDEAMPWVILGRLTGEEDHAVVISAPDFDQFTEALEDGAIDGELSDDGNTLHIQGEKASLDDLIDPDHLHELFNMQEPMVITRISGLE